MNWQLTAHALGGLALFLLAMQMMTDGLKAFAGGALKRLLEQWTSTVLRGVFSGILVTGLVQSSSAVTVATIGFVNAGVLTLRQALGVIFGTNVGTTMTGWLVAVVGFGFKIEALALPILTVGVMLRLLAPRKRLQGLGWSLAGFGLFFLGLAFLKDAFASLAASHGASLAMHEGGVGGWLLFLFSGFVATLLTQSSSAAIAIILTAASGGMVSVEPAAAAVIGANIGTTSTAALAVLKATSSAKRLALGHIAFNLITGIVALSLLPVMLWLVTGLGELAGLEGRPAVSLALFHTVFNVLGVVIMIPFTNRMATVLERMFRSAEEDLGRPRHLDATLASTPELAVAALRQELLRLRGLVSEVAQAAVTRDGAAMSAVEKQSAALRLLGDAIAGYVARLRAEAMPLDVGEELARALRIGRYLNEAARLCPDVHSLREEISRLPQVETQAILQQTLADAAVCIALSARIEAVGESDSERAVAFEQFQKRYQEAKAALLMAVVAGRLTVEETDSRLDSLSAMRRMVEQLVKADRLLRNPERAKSIEVDEDREPALNNQELARH